MVPQVSSIDAVLRIVDREVWIVTATDGKCRGGLLATWVSSASIDPDRPALLAGIAPNHFTAELVQASGAFAAHLLRPDQVELAWRFASGSGRDRDKLAGFELKGSATGSPILANCLAWCDCRVFARYDAGDRLFFWADVIAAEQLGAGAALRERALFAGLTTEQRQTLLADRDTDSALQRPLHEAWRNRTRSE
jgi:flavin reductase (DIM6/NTAB) family NADH-FMN oxidoreductase RutF